MKDKINEYDGGLAERMPGRAEESDEAHDDVQSEPRGKKVITYRGPCCDTFDATD